MELYPAGLFPENYPSYDEPALEQQQPRKRRLGCSQEAREAALVLPPPSRKPQVASESLPEDDMELLERIMRECRISDEMESSTGQQSSISPSVPLRAATASCAAPAQASCGYAAPTATTADQWAEVMVRQLQGCSSVEEAVPKCRELLGSVVQQQLQQHRSDAANDAQRLRTLQSANSALLRGFRNGYYRQRDMAAKQQQLEEENQRLREELLRSQEALRGSERAKEALKCHLQLMNPHHGSGDLPAPGL